MASRDDSVDQFIKHAAPLTPEAQAKYDEYRGRRGNELQLWTQWQQSGKDPKHLEPLLKSLAPVIRSEANKRMQGLGGSIPRSAVESELRIAAVKSLGTYDPDKAALTTHVTGGFRRISDFVNANRNAKYVPGEDMKRYEVFRNASSELHQELGRQPTPHELKDRLPWSVKTIQKMQKSFGREVFTDMGDGLSPDESYAALTPRDAFQLARSGMTQEEQEFGHRFFPPEGEKQPAIRNIASALGIPAHRAYRLKASVESRVGKILKRE